MLYGAGTIISAATVICLVYMLYIIIKIKGKKQIHYTFFIFMSSILIWTVGTFLLEYYYLLNRSVNIIALDIAYIGLITSPIGVLFLGLVFAKTRIKMSYKYFPLFIIPIISIVMLLTNDRHHLFYRYINYDELTHATALGEYFIIHTIYSYVCIVLGVGYLIYSSIKSTGFFSKQSLLIVMGGSVPLVFNFLLTVQLIDVKFYTNTFALFIMTIFFFLAIFKFKFLNIAPIALQKVVNIISDGYVVISEEYDVVDFNRAFSELINIKRKSNLIDVLIDTHFIEIGRKELIEDIHRAIREKRMISVERKSIFAEEVRYFDMEISPILSDNMHIGTILLFKDITQHINDLEQIKQSQNILMEQERLVTLGQLAGGMAHDINTPLSSIATGVDYFAKRIEKDENSELMINAVRKSIAKISSIVNSVRDQIRNLGTERYEEFNLIKLVTNVEALLFTETKKNNCKIEIVNTEDIILEGDIGKLEQVITNIVLNSVQAYEGKGGIINIEIYKEESNAVIKVSDKAGGIPPKIAESLLKQIVSTKGSRGTGFGLYFSNSIIKGLFKGEIKFETEQGVGTTFYVILPIYK